MFSPVFIASRANLSTAHCYLADRETQRETIERKNEETMTKHQEIAMEEAERRRDRLSQKPFSHTDCAASPQQRPFAIHLHFTAMRHFVISGTKPAFHNLQEAWRVTHHRWGWTAFLKQWTNMAVTLRNGSNIHIIPVKCQKISSSVGRVSTSRVSRCLHNLLRLSVYRSVTFLTPHYASVTFPQMLRGNRPLFKLYVWKGLKTKREKERSPDEQPGKYVAWTMGKSLRSRSRSNSGEHD